MARRGLPAPYGGNLFRSHLEARWAIFFDQLEIKWLYEPQGFDLGAGVLYLPDFVLFPALGTVWAEIKPEWEADPEGVEKWRQFATVRPEPEKTRAALLVGPPSADGEHVVIGGLDPADTDSPLQGPWEDSSQLWRPCPAGYHFDLAWPGKYWTKFADDGCEDCFGGDGVDRLDAAVRAAMSHRFGKFGPPPGKAA